MKRRGFKTNHNLYYYDKIISIQFVGIEPRNKDFRTKNTENILNKIQNPSDKY